MARVKEDVPYLLIHPAWRAAWCWDKVLGVMQAWGREAYAVDCPGHGPGLVKQRTFASRTIRGL